MVNQNMVEGWKPGQPAPMGYRVKDYSLIQLPKSPATITPITPISLSPIPQAEQPTIKSGDGTRQMQLSDLSPEQQAESLRIDAEAREKLKPIEAELNTKKARWQELNAKSASLSGAEQSEYLDLGDNIREIQNAYDAMARLYQERRLNAAGVYRTYTGPTAEQASKVYEQTTAMSKGGKEAFDYALQNGLIPKDAIYVSSEGKGVSYITPQQQRDQINTLVTAGVLTTKDLRRLNLNEDVSGKLKLAVERYNQDNRQAVINDLVTQGIITKPDEIKALDGLNNEDFNAKTQRYVETYNQKQVDANANANKAIQIGNKADISTFRNSLPVELQGVLDQNGADSTEFTTALADYNSRIAETQQTKIAEINKLPYDKGTKDVLANLYQRGIDTGDYTQYNLATANIAQGQAVSYKMRQSLAGPTSKGVLQLSQEDYAAYQASTPEQKLKLLQSTIDPSTGKPFAPANAVVSGTDANGNPMLSIPGTPIEPGASQPLPKYNYQVSVSQINKDIQSGVFKGVALNDLVTAAKQAGLYDVAIKRLSGTDYQANTAALLGNIPDISKLTPAQLAKAIADSKSPMAWWNALTPDEQTNAAAYYVPVASTYGRAYNEVAAVPFPAVKVLLPEVTAKDIKFQEWVTTGVNAAIIPLAAAGSFLLPASEAGIAALGNIGRATNTIVAGSGLFALGGAVLDIKNPAIPTWQKVASIAVDAAMVGLGVKGMLKGPEDEFAAIQRAIGENKAAVRATITAESPPQVTAALDRYFTAADAYTKNLVDIAKANESLSEIAPAGMAIPRDAALRDTIQQLTEETPKLKAALSDAATTFEQVQKVAPAKLMTEDAKLALKNDYNDLQQSLQDALKDKAQNINPLTTDTNIASIRAKMADIQRTLAGGGTPVIGKAGLENTIPYVLDEEGRPVSVMAQSTIGSIDNAVDRFFNPIKYSNDLAQLNAEKEAAVKALAVVTKSGEALPSDIEALNTKLYQIDQRIAVIGQTQALTTAAAQQRSLTSELKTLQNSLDNITDTSPRTAEPSAYDSFTGIKGSTDADYQRAMIKARMAEIRTQQAKIDQQLKGFFNQENIVAEGGKGGGEGGGGIGPDGKPLTPTEERLQGETRATPTAVAEARAANARLEQSFFDKNGYWPSPSGPMYAQAGTITGELIGVGLSAIAPAIAPTKTPVVSPAKAPKVFPQPITTPGRTTSPSVVPIPLIVPGRTPARTSQPETVNPSAIPLITPIVKTGVTNEPGINPITTPAPSTVTTISPTVEPESTPSPNIVQSPSIVPTGTPSVAPGTVKTPTTIKAPSPVNVPVPVPTPVPTPAPVIVPVPVPVPTPTPIKVKPTVTTAEPPVKPKLPIRGIPAGKDGEDSQPQVIQAEGGQFVWQQGKLRGKPVFHVGTLKNGKVFYSYAIGRPPPGAVVIPGKGQAKRTLRVIGQAPTTKSSQRIGFVTADIIPIGNNRIEISFERNRLSDNNFFITPRTVRITGRQPRITPKTERLT